MAVLYATVGEIIVERSGVLNLGVEGMMLVGALAGFAGTYFSHSLGIGILAAVFSGGAMALIHGFFSITLRLNQIVSGLALTMLGTGLTNFLGRPLLGKPTLRLINWPVPFFSDLPVLGKVFFQQNALVYPAYLLIPLVSFFLYRTTFGLNIRSVGENPFAADTVGIHVTRIRYLCTFTGGCFAGLAGAYLSLGYIPGWKEQMTSGQGWIAIAMVIFAMWDPMKAVIGSLLFGFINALQFYFQISAASWVPAYFLKMLPYLMTIGVLWTVNVWRGRWFNTPPPAALMIPFKREE
ncbi:MAG TPA: ABC transporter permease [Desulfobacteraceae bacterium]|nr:ABC transporter permease [Desulfobacteraceae bacterium]